MAVRSVVVIAEELADEETRESLPSPRTSRFARPPGAIPLPGQAQLLIVLAIPGSPISTRACITSMALPSHGCPPMSLVPSLYHE
jgi:hypothetical protein